jgi:hypothetical protein
MKDITTEDILKSNPKHAEILNRLTIMLADGQKSITNQIPNWEEVDRSMTGYVQLDEIQKKIKNKDDRKPVTLTIPSSFAVYDTLITYWTSAFFNGNMFKYVPISPDDTVKTIVLEALVNNAIKRSKSALDLYTMWGDGLKYNLGAVHINWDKKYVKAPEYAPTTRVSGNESYLEDTFIGYKDNLIWEGNSLTAIDPYTLIIDPNVPIHKFQEGTFIGWVSFTNRMNILERERIDNSYTNGKELKEDDFDRSLYYSKGIKDSAVRELTVYVNLIPKEWGLGDGEYPEKWLFVVANDNTLLRATPYRSYHNMYPIAINSPDFDGHTDLAMSRLARLSGMQSTMDWLITSHITNVRKSINDMLIVDPSMINMQDLTEPGPGKLIRLRRSSFGKPIGEAIKQLQVNDITKGHVQDVNYFMDLSGRVSGASDNIQGVQQRKGERVSAEEAKGTRLSGLSRLEKLVNITDIQAHSDIALICAYNAIQLSSNKIKVKIVDPMQQALLKEYGQDQDYIDSAGEDLKSLQFDVLPHDGTSQLIDDAQSWLTLYDIASKNPALIGKLDLGKVFMHIARGLGAKNVDSFMINVVPDGQGLEGQIPVGDLPNAL